MSYASFNNVSHFFEIEQRPLGILPVRTDCTSDSTDGQFEFPL